MSDTPDTTDDPAVIGVPAATPESVRPSVTGVVKGPIDEGNEVEDVEPSFVESEEPVVDAGGARVDATHDPSPETEGPDSA
jgi:hypothetical protein